jgi:N-acyl-D-aspartate/D-glutamate deacylase
VSRFGLSGAVVDGGRELVGTFDMLIRGGTVIDGTGAPARVADVAIVNDHVVDVAPGIVGAATRVIDATDRVVTPGFVDIHTHLDAQLAWDPIGSSSCYHGITSVVMGNCGVTFAPCKPEDREVLAAMMESVEDIPRDAILDGLAWDWVTYGEYLESMARLPKGLNVGGMVGHCALRRYAMGERGIDEAPPTADDLAVMTDLLAEAMRGGALGFSTSRTFLHKVPDGRPVPGTYAQPDELFAFADVLGRHGAGVFESASRIGEGERDDVGIPGTRAEMAWMGEVSRRSGRPVSFGLLQHDSRPDLYSQVIELAKHENSLGATVRPQTTARSVGVLFSLDTRSPFDRSSCWRELKDMRNGKKLVALRDPVMRARLIEAADVTPPGLDLARLFVVNNQDGRDGGARYDLDPSTSLAAIAHDRGISAAAAYIELQLETDGTLICSFPFLNQQLSAVEEMLDEKLVTLGLADAGAHVGQILDASQPTFLLSYWIRQRQRWSLEEGVRRLTSDTADLFGLAGRGRLTSGSFADVNVIDLDALDLPAPSYVYDFPHGAGRYVQGATGYDYTLVNGQVFMDHGEHTGAFAGAMLKNALSA